QGKRSSRVRGGSTGEPKYVASGLLHASAVGGWRPLRPSGPSLESEDVGIHLRRPQQYPHHRPRPIRADAAPRVAGGERYGPPWPAPTALAAQRPSARSPPRRRPERRGQTPPPPTSP